MSEFVYYLIYAALHILSIVLSKCTLTKYFNLKIYTNKKEYLKCATLSLIKFKLALKFFSFKLILTTNLNEVFLFITN